jgi:anti-sigma factor RsiW
MGPHEEFLELCATATAGELSAAEQAKLNAHLAVCPECREAVWLCSRRNSSRMNR